jgi:predicted Holliday junction resolvase-like endonuclease
MVHGDAVTFALLAAGALILVLAFLLWKAQYTRAVRQDAVQRSLAVTAGKVYEQLLPYLPDFPFNPKDVRFLGSPVDFVVFDGLSDGEVSRVVFVEVKTGAAELSTRERWVRDAVRERHVEWHELRLENRA